MVMNKQGVDVTPESPKDENLPVATVLPAEDVPDPEIKPWHFTDFEQELAQQKQEKKVVVTQALRREIEKKKKKETQLLKKEAYETAQKEGYEAGFAQGEEAGRTQAFEQAKQQADARLSKQVASLETVIETLAEPYQHLKASVFESLASLAIELAGRLVHLEVSQHQAWLYEAIEQAVNQLPDEQAAVEVQLHPDDLASIEAHLNQDHAHWNLVASKHISPGSCQVKQGHSVVVNDWKTRLDALLGDAQALAKRMESTSAEDAPAHES